VIYRYLDRVYGSGDIYLRLAGILKTYSSNSEVISGYSDLYVLMQKSYVAIYEQIELCDNINVGIDKLIAINSTNRVGLTEEARLTQKLLIGVSKLLTTVSGVLIGTSNEFSAFLKQVIANEKLINISAEQVIATAKAFYQNIQAVAGAVKDFTEALKIVVGDATELSNVPTTSKVGYEVIFEYVAKIVDSLYTSTDLLTKMVNGVKEDIAQNLTLDVGEEVEIASLLDSITTILRKLFGYRTIVGDLRKFTTDIQLITDKATVEELNKILTDIKGLDRLRAIVDEFRKLR